VVGDSPGRRMLTREYESTRDKERIASGSSARRGHAHRVGVRLGRMGSVGRRLPVVDGLVSRVNSRRRAVVDV
jgi:hypothetical protein